MAKARAIVKRRKAVRNIRKITKTMQMIATAKFQKSLKRAVGTKPYTQKIREMVGELAASVGDVEHPLLRRPTDETRKKLIAVLGHAQGQSRPGGGAYNGSVLRRIGSVHPPSRKPPAIRLDLFVTGKKRGQLFPVSGSGRLTKRVEVSDQLAFSEVEPDRQPAH